MNTNDNSDSETSETVQTVPKNPDPDLAPKAVAARVGDRDLWIGNVVAVKPRLLAEMDLDPEYVVNRLGVKPRGFLFLRRALQTP